jgi:Ni/Co efflux regulator RcnB
MSRNGGPVPHSDWRKGDRLPPEYRGRNYVVDDWRGRGLAAPPRGYQWIGVNGDYVLAAIATGVIASILMSPR